jgi:hypothetical protein
MSGQSAVDPQNFRESLTNAIRYWEPRRVAYNVILAAIVLTYFGLNYPASKEGLLSVNGALFIFVLAVLANVAYCSAYVADILAQSSGFRPVWVKYRWILLIIGIFFAGTITRFLALGMFALSSTNVGR